MPRYFFHTHDGVDILDETGAEFPDLAAAKKHAVVFAGELMRDWPGSFLTDDDWVMTIAEDGGPLFTLSFRTCLAPAQSKD